MTIVLKLGLVVFLIALGGLFVAAEFALVAADRVRIEQLAATGDRAAKRAAEVLKRLSFHLGGTQLGVTVVSLMLGFLAEATVAAAIRPAVDPWAGSATDGISVALALTITTVVSMVAGELIPKAIAISRAQDTTMRLAPLIHGYGQVLGPLVRALNAVASGTVRRLGIEPREELATSRNLEELMVVIETSADEGEIEPASRELLERSIRFGGKTAATALVPRVRVTALPASATVGDLVILAGSTGFSRFPIFAADLDNIVGVVHAKRAFRIPFELRATTPVTEIMDEPLVVPETRDLDELMLQLKDHGFHLAVVIDEYGGTAGIITVEDVLEEIVGDIADEHDPLAPRLVQVENDRFRIAATLHTDEVRDATEFELPEGDYETIAGFVLERLGRIPTVGESLTQDGWHIEVSAADRVRVIELLLTPPPNRQGTDADEDDSE